MTQDTFINLDLLYEKIDKPIDDLRTKVFWAEKWINRDELFSVWVPEKVKGNIERSLRESQEALDLIDEIKEILLDFKLRSRNKSKVDAQQKSRIRHLKVIKGGI